MPILDNKEQLKAAKKVAGIPLRRLLRDPSSVFLSVNRTGDTKG